MLRNTIFLSAILTSAVVFSAAANAGSTITDKSYWPNEIHQQTRASEAYRAATPLESFASAGQPGSVAPQIRAGAWTYSGGPKGR